MPVRVLFFGAPAEIVGCREIEMAGAHGLPTREVYARLLSIYPDLSRHRLLMSINQQYSTGNEIIRGGDEIAVFTAVSGG